MIDFKATIVPDNAVQVVTAVEKQGPMGFVGSKGDPGIAGYSGSKGDLGYTGSRGAGYTGSKGNQGNKGDLGYTGSRGITGYSGSRGDTGFTGSIGSTGFTGSKGSDGSVGYSGSRGLIGPVGYSGSVGFTGSKGTGFTGSRGVQGFTGSGGNGIGIAWQFVTSSYSASVGDFLLVNTDSSPVTITLPRNPSQGNFVVVSNISTILVNQLIINRNGQTINYLADNLEIDVPNSKIEFIFNGTTWDILSTVGSRGYTGSSSGFTGSTGAGGSPKWVLASSTYAAKPFDSIMADATAGAFSIHLPFNPEIGTSISIADITNSTSTNRITINNNGQTIEDTADNLVMDLNAFKLDLVFTGTTWRVFANSIH